MFQHDPYFSSIFETLNGNGTQAAVLLLETVDYEIIEYSSMCQYFIVIIAKNTQGISNALSIMVNPSEK